MALTTSLTMLALAPAPSALPSIGVYTDPSAPTLCAVVDANVPIDLYVVTESALGGQAFYQFGLRLDPSLTLIGTPTIFPAGAVDTGDDSLVDGLNFVVDTEGVCIEGPLTLLVQLQVVVPPSAEPLEVCVITAVSPEFQAAGYLACDCQENCFQYYGAPNPNPGCHIRDACLEMRVLPVATSRQDWGTLKGMFADID